VHGEEAAIEALAARLGGIVDNANVLRPGLDWSFELTGTGAERLVSIEPPRLPPEKVARLDWHNDVSNLILDINESLKDSPDEKSRSVLIRRLRRALVSDSSKQGDKQFPRNG
jgi:metallo-beta-lactamase family protein